MKKQFYFLLTFAGFFLLSALALVAQCPMCKAAVESQEGASGNALQEGLNHGILYLFVLPYLCVGIFMFFVWRYYRKAKAAERAAAHAG